MLYGLARRYVIGAEDSEKRSCSSGLTHAKNYDLQRPSFDTFPYKAWPYCFQGNWSESVGHSPQKAAVTEQLCAVDQKAVTPLHLSRLLF